MHAMFAPIAMEPWPPRTSNASAYGVRGSRNCRRIGCAVSRYCQFGRLEDQREPNVAEPTPDRCEVIVTILYRCPSTRRSPRLSGPQTVRQPRDLPRELRLATASPDPKFRSASGMLDWINLEGWQNGYCTGLENRRRESGLQVRILCPPLFAWPQISSCAAFPRPSAPPDESRCRSRLRALPRQ